jgi:hypothetical protein
MAALDCLQELFGYSFASFVVIATGQFAADPLQRHFQIGGRPAVKVRYGTRPQKGAMKREQA